MKSILFSLMLFFFGALISNAQNGIIKGKITDAKSGEELIGVNISVKGSLEGATSDIEGNYEIELPAGSYTIIYSYVGYTDKEEAITVTENQTITKDIQLSESLSLLDEVVVTSSKFERRVGEETVSIDVIKPEVLAKQNMNTVDDALKRSPGVTVVDGQANIRGGSGYSYGAGTRVLLLMDDLPALQADAGFPSWSSLPVENIGQIEIIKGAASALYGSSAMNGIINLRTAYPTSEPYAKFSVFGSVIDNPNQKEKIGVFDTTTHEFTGEIIETKVNKNWWELDSITLQGSEVAGLFPVPEIRLKNDFRRRPYSFGFSWAYREKITKSKKLDFIFSGQLYKEQKHNWGANETRGRFNINTNYHVNEKIQIGVNTNILGAKSQTFFLWGGSGIDKYIPGAVTGIPTESRSFRITIDPYFKFADSKGNSHKILTRYYRTDIDNSNNQDNASDYYYGQYQYQRNFSKINFVLTTGFVGSYTKSVSELFGNTNHTGFNLAGFFQLSKKFWDRVGIDYGFRFESNRIDNDKIETKPVSRVGINVEAAKYTFIRASFGQGYRFPAIAEKFISTPLSESFGIYPNPNLTSETGLTAELGIKQGIKLGRDFNAYIDVAGFYQQYTDMIEFNLGVYNNEALGFFAKNIGNTRIYGTEVTLMGEGKLFNKFPTTLVTGYTFTVPQYRNYNEAEQYSDVVDYNVLKYRFRHQVQAQWDISFGLFDFGATLQYYSAMENWDGIFGEVLPSLYAYKYSQYRNNWASKKPQRQSKGEVVLDLRAAVNFGENDKFRFSFLVKNVTNNEYTLRPALVEAPRNYGFRFDATFK
ncbi:MAG: TonB-dependent receptor [Chitinophagales bacterium]|nr:TonB-dependent receptor [Chitinophagales bacterium]